MKVSDALRIALRMPTDLLELIGDEWAVLTYILPEWSFDDWPDTYAGAVRTWPEFSGWVEYPVPGPKDERDGLRHNPLWARRNLPLWSGEYGESRRRWVQHLVDYFEMADE